MAPPQTNAQLLEVRHSRTTAGPGGAVDDWDIQVPAPAEGSPQEDALVKWAGSVRGYYRESTTRENGPDGATTVLLKRELVLETADVLEAGIDTDDILKFAVDGRSGTLTGRAAVIPTPALAGVPRALQTARIRLEDA